MSRARVNANNVAAKINQAFGDRLATVRKLKGLSQTALAESVDYSRATIANLELGKQNVQLHQLFSLARVLNTKPVDLLPEVDMIYLGSGSQADVFVQMAKMRINVLVGDAG
jgi:transcriptional regulator with XRE-family HTH domain